MLLLFAFFKAASLDGRMAFLVAVHYMIFWGYNFVCKFGE